MKCYTLNWENRINLFFRFIIKHLFLNYEQVEYSMTLRLNWPIVANTYSAGLQRTIKDPRSSWDFLWTTNCRSLSPFAYYQRLWKLYQYSRTWNSHEISFHAQYHGKVYLINVDIIYLHRCTINCFKKHVFTKYLYGCYTSLGIEVCHNYMLYMLYFFWDTVHKIHKL